MIICIQDPVHDATYVVEGDALERFAVAPDADAGEVDVLFVVPTDALVQELPATRLSDAASPTIQIVDPDANRSWVIPAAALDELRVAVPPTSGDVVWFAMPSARELVAAVPVFRRALVQHSC
jgi:hypothetical protein